MKKSIIFLLHLGIWVAYIFFLLLLIGIYFQGEVPDDKLAYYFEILLGIAFFPAFVTFYGFYFLIFPNYSQHKNFWQSTFFGLSIIGIATFLSGLSMYPILDKSGKYNLSGFLEGSPLIFSIALIFGLIGLVIRGFLTWLEEIKLKETLKQKNHEMEMALVKAQLDPHFLFNTINNIDVLIIDSAQEASNYLNKLSDIMRFMLFETKTTEIALVKELEYIKKYIDLQKIRTSNTQYVNFSVQGNPQGQTVAPMVFIPFIENAFKHTNNKKLKDAINIQILIDQQKIKLDCVNKFDPSQKANIASNGLGNELIKKRLQLIYPDNHLLKINRQKDIFSIELTINHGKI